MHDQLASTKSLVGFPSFVKELGGDFNALCDEAGISKSLVCDEEAMVSYASMAQLLELSAIQCQCSDFAVRLTSLQSELNVGILGLLLKNCDTLGEVLSYLTRFYYLQTQATSLQLVESGGYVNIVRVDMWANKVPTFQYATLTFAHCLKGIRFFLGKEWTPSYITFTHKKPDNYLDYESHFGCPIEYLQSESAFGFLKGELDTKVSGNSPLLKRYMKEQMQQLAEISGNPVVRRVKFLVRRLIHSDNCSQENVASLLHMHPKKMQRELHRVGTSYREIRQESRIELAEHYLKESDVTLTEIAEMVGFSELSAFSRAFYKVHHIFPAEWRDRALATERS